MAHRAVAGRLRGVGVGKSKELSDQRLTVLWLRPHCRAIDALSAHSAAAAHTAALPAG